MDTTIAVIDSALHVGHEIVHSVPSAGSDWTSWAAFAIATVAGIIGWWKYKQAMKRK